MASKPGCSPGHAPRSGSVIAMLTACLVPFRGTAVPHSLWSESECFNCAKWVCGLDARTSRHHSSFRSLPRGLSGQRRCQREAHGYKLYPSSVCACGLGFFFGGGGGGTGWVEDLLGSVFVGRQGFQLKPREHDPSFHSLVACARAMRSHSLGNGSLVALVLGSSQEAAKAVKPFETQTSRP